MANALYNTFKQDLLNKVFNLSTDAVRSTLTITPTYTFSAAHANYGGGTPDVPTAAKVAESGTLGAPTITNGVFDTNDFTWLSVPVGPAAQAILLWDNTVSTGRLILYMDTGISGMPITPNGGNINVTINASGWFAL